MFEIGDKITEIFSNLIQFIFDAIIEPFLGLSSLQDLVFGTNDDGKLIWSTFTKSEIADAFSPAYNTTMTVAVLLVVQFLVLFGIRIAKNGMSPQARTELIQTALAFLLVGIGLRYLPFFYDVLFALNSLVLDIFRSAHADAILTLDDVDKDVKEPLGQILLQLVILGLSIWANFYYLMRKITLIILMGLGPLFITMLLHPRLKSLTFNWMKETISTIAVQSVHALTYWILAVISLSQTTIVGTLITFVVFIPVSAAVRNLFGLGGQMNDGISKAGAAFGVSSLMALGGAVKGAMGGKSLGEVASGALNTFRGNYSKSKGADGAITPNGDVKDAVGHLPGNDKGTSKDAAKMLRNGEILSNIGKGTLGALGAITGAGLGPMGSAAIAGAGYAIGDTTFGAAGRMGTALGQQAQERLKRANALMGSGGMTEDQLQNADIDTVADAIAEKEASEWATQNENDIRNDLRSRYPDASEQEIDTLFAQEKASRKAKFKDKAAQQLQAAASYGNEHMSTDELANTSSQAMANQWAKDNRANFNEDYAKENPQLPNETDQAFNERMAKAFNGKKKEMERVFKINADSAIKESINEFGDIKKSDFVESLSKQVGEVEGVSNPDGLAILGANNGKSVSLFNTNGRLNKDNTVSALVSSATLQDKENFVAVQGAKGISRADALVDWNDNYAQGTQDKYQAQFGNSKVGNTISNGLKLNGEAFERANNNMPTLSKRISAIGNSMILDTANSLNNHSTALRQGIDAVKLNAANSMMEGKGVFSTITNATTGGVKAVKDAYAQSGIEQVGSAVDAQAQFQNNVGYVGGVLFGANGYVAGKKLGLKVSPYKQHADNEISSATEVMQMAQTTTDDKGNVVLAPGAVRQVVTADSSYIEVLTRSGERKRVSRVTAGDSGLKTDDIVYQDLQMQDNMLVPVMSKGGGGTYRQVQGGARVPSDVQIMQNPNTLLKQAAIQKINIPTSPLSSNQGAITVSSHDTYTPTEIEQLAIKDGNNVKRGAIRQVVTSDSSYVEVRGNDGKVRRVSPIGKGNSNLSSGQVLYQDLDVNDGQFIPVAAKVGSNKSATYMVDSMGQKMASQFKVSQNPNDLFKNVEVKANTSSTPKGKEFPSFSQFVDSGQFFTEDLASNGMGNVQVVVEKDRSFVTAEKQGIRYRVSPVYSGDSRLSSNDVQEIQMGIQKGQLKPVSSSADNSAKATVYSDSQVNENEDVFSSKLNNFMISRTFLNAQKSAASRKLLDEARQKSGVTG